MAIVANRQRSTSGLLLSTGRIGFLSSDSVNSDLALSGAAVADITSRGFSCGCHVFHCSGRSTTTTTESLRVCVNRQERQSISGSLSPTHLPLLSAVPSTKSVRHPAGWKRHTCAPVVPCASAVEHAEVKCYYVTKLKMREVTFFFYFSGVNKNQLSLELQASEVSAGVSSNISTLKGGLLRFI